VILLLALAAFAIGWESIPFVYYGQTPWLRAFVPAMLFTLWGIQAWRLRKVAGWSRLVLLVSGLVVGLPATRLLHPGNWCVYSGVCDI
jgi:hypothetical protein